MENFQEILIKLKKIWMRFALKGIRYSNNYKKFDFFYIVNDPWNLASQSEQYRFEETNRLILNKFGKVKSLLEIGCGEGHQSLKLQQVCESIIGLDISERAIKRARKRCPGVEFLVGDIFSKEVSSRAPFDLVVACEVLYYIKNIPTFIKNMQTLGRYNFVTYFAGEMETLDPLVLSLPGAESKVLKFKSNQWRAVWWCNY